MNILACVITQRTLTDRENVTDCVDIFGERHPRSAGEGVEGNDRRAMTSAQKKTAGKSRPSGRQDDQAARPRRCMAMILACT